MSVASLSAQLLMTYCLISNPQECKKELITFSEPLSIQACSMNIFYTAVLYNQTNPKWKFKKGVCLPLITEKI